MTLWKAWIGNYKNNMEAIKAKEQPVVNAMTVDVEDYFQVSAFEQYGVKSTFFVLGWVAERYPEIVKNIVAQGHELASHGYGHHRATQQTRTEFRDDIVKAKDILEDISGINVKGYRAPSYSISKENLWVHDELYDAGYLYSSSVYPVKHDLYGIPDAPRFKYQLNSGLIEIPISTLNVANKNFPIGGGGFFRLYPYFLSRWNLRHLNSSENQPAIFYFHPWEIDTEQPKQKNIGYKTKFRHYLNLHRMEIRLARLLTDFSWNRVDRVFLS